MALKDNWYREIRKAYDHTCGSKSGIGVMESKQAREAFESNVQEEFEAVGTDQISLRRLAEHTIGDSPSEGREFVSLMQPGTGGVQALMEAGGMPSTGAFAKITGQWLFTDIMDQLPEQNLIQDQVCSTMETPFEYERIPGIGGVGDLTLAIGEGQPYPEASVVPEYIDTPATIKRGLIVSCTDEMVFFDRTGVLLERSREQGNFIFINKEKRILDAVLGITNTFKYNGTDYNTYLTSGLYINVKSSNALADWTDVENARLLWPDMTDPTTGEPINIVASDLIVPEALEDTAYRVVSATEVRHGSDPVTLSANPLNRRPRLNVITNAYVSDRSSSTSTWWLGRPREAFVYMQNYPLQVMQEMANTGAHFDRDVFYRFKFRERGAIAVKRPWKMIKSTSA